MASSLDRRRFLGVGTFGTIGALGGIVSVEAGAVQSGPRATDDSTVRMLGDGLGLTPRECAQVWAALAESGDIAPDDYSNGGSVEKLEQAFAAELGKERAVFMPTGTLANHLAVRALAGGPGRVVVQAESHLYNDSGDCVQALSNLPLIPLGAGRASFGLDELEQAVERARTGRVATDVRVVSIESPVRRGLGATFEPRELDRIVAFARRHDIRLHLDGARMYIQAAYEGRPVAEYAAPFDTVYVSLYKYFNAPSGAILAGPRALLDGMYHTRRMFGAGLPAAWPFAAVARHFLPGFVDRFRQAINVSEAWARRIERHEAFTVERIERGTNLMYLRVTGNAAGFRIRMRDAGVILGAPRADGRFLLGVNETWTRRPADELAGLFVNALG
jgi:threonine aldolase